MICMYGHILVPILFLLQLLKIPLSPSYTSEYHALKSEMFNVNFVSFFFGKVRFQVSFTPGDHSGRFQSMLYVRLQRATKCNWLLVGRRRWLMVGQSEDPRPKIWDSRHQKIFYIQHQWGKLTEETLRSSSHSPNDHMHCTMGFWLSAFNVLAFSRTLSPPAREER